MACSLAPYYYSLNLEKNYYKIASIIDLCTFLGTKAEISGILSEAENAGSGCSKLRARFFLSKRAKKTTDCSTEHRGQNSFDCIAKPGPPAAAQTVPGGEKLHFESRKKIEEAIMTTLRGGDVKLGKCENIKSLELRYCETMKSIIRTSILDDDAIAATDPFSLIEYLYLESLPELEEICDGPISSTSFQNLNELQLASLRVLTHFWKSSSVCENNNNVPHFTNLSSIFIYNCPSLRNLGQLSMAGKDCLPQLQELYISECEMMEHVFLWNDHINRIQLRQNHHVITKVFPKLKEVWLRSLPNLTTFCQGIEGIEFPLLTKMVIEYCPQMKRIIMPSKDEDIDDDDHSLHLFCQSQKVSFGSSLEVLEMSHNPFCRHELPSSLFNGLKEVTIYRYESSMSLFTLSVAANLVSLRELSIENCDEMINVIEDKEQQGRILVFPKLEELYLDGLPKLVSFCGSKCEVELPSLNKMVIKRCSNLEDFSLGLVATPILKAFNTDLTTYVGVGVHVAFDSMKELEIRNSENPFVDRKITVSLFNRLEKLVFFGYKGSMSLFPSSAVGNLVNLKVLEITSCGEVLVTVIEDEEEEEKVMSGGVVFPELEELVLGYLPKLERFCECDIEFPSLNQVVIFGCPNMENFSMGFVVTPNLKIISLNKDYIDVAEGLNSAVQHILSSREKEKEEEEEKGSTEEEDQN